MKLKPLSTFELSAIPTQKQKPISDEIRAQLCDFFSDCGIPRTEIVLMEGPQKFAVSIYTRSLKKKDQIKKQFKKHSPKGVKLQERLLVREDWYDKWQTDYQIMPIGKTFVLVPEWKRKEYRPGKRNAVFLDPLGVSGSGQHPTTQIMVDLLEKIAGKSETCLDLGTGTGILGIIAAKLGVESVMALDNDRRAVRAARLNFKLNGISHARAEFNDVSRAKKTPKYDLVCANLISPLLEKIDGYLFSSVKPGGYLAVSGIHVQNFPDFYPKFKHPHFRCLKILKRRGWTGILFHRKIMK